MNEKWHSQEWSLECNDTPRAGSQQSLCSSWTISSSSYWLSLTATVECFNDTTSDTPDNDLLWLLFHNPADHMTTTLIEHSSTNYSSPLVQILKFLTIHWSLTEGVYPCFLFDSVVKNDYQEIVWHVVLC